MLFYIVHMPLCPYKFGHLWVIPGHTFLATVVCVDPYLCSEFDTVIMMTVLEHKHDALCVLQNTHEPVLCVMNVFLSCNEASTGLGEIT